MSDDLILKDYFSETLKNSLYIAKYLKRKELWHPEPFRNTGRVKIANSIYELF